MAPRTLARSRIPADTTWAHPGWYGMDVFYADGGDTDTAPAADTDDTDTDGGDGEPADDWTPPSRAEYEKLMADKKKADGEAAARRKYLRAHGIDPKTGNKLEPDEPDPDPAQPADQTQTPAGVSPADMKRAIDRASAEAELRGRRQSRALVTGVNSALAEAGWNGQRLNSLMKLIDLDEVEIEDDGSVVGLSDQIDSIKSEWPEFFKRTRSANPANGAGGSGQNGVPGAKVDAADKKPPAPEPKGWAQQVAERALRG